MIARALLAIILAVSTGCGSRRVSVPGAATDCAAQVRGSHGRAIDPDCLRLGPVVLGMSRAQVEKVLGPADLDVSEPANCTNAVYVLDRNVLGPTATPPLQVSTLRLVYRGGHVSAVEANGGAARERFGFDPVRLGDTTEALERAFGSPEVLSAQVWRYQPLLVLLDDAGRRVEAIALTEEDAFACILPATFQSSCEGHVTVVRPPNDELRLHGLREWPGTIVRRAAGCGQRTARPKR